jgi:uncharacterized protein (DUF1778 family)
VETNGHGLVAHLVQRVADLEGAFALHMRREHRPLAARLAEMDRNQHALTDALDAARELIAEHQERLALLQTLVPSTGEEGGPR